MEEKKVRERKMKEGKERSEGGRMAENERWLEN